MQSRFYRPLCQVWTERIAAALKAKDRFTKVGDQCNHFFEAGAGFMWETKFKKEYFSGSLPSPKFKITIAKMYEFVSIYGPHLYWQYANRKVVSHRKEHGIKIRPEHFGDPNDPTVQQAYQQVMQQDAGELSMSDFANELMGSYLNWSQREQPGGALHAQMAITETLIKGMGCLWPDVYSFAGSSEKFTRLRYQSVDNLVIDPDCTDPLLETAGYIALRHVTPIWQLENKFGLKRGTLNGRGNNISMEQVSRDSVKNSAGQKQTFDRIEWWEIWSKCGVGPRTSSLSHQVLDELDESLGDYAYLCVAKGVDFPLNAHPDRFFGEEAASQEDVSQMFEWRCAGFGEPFPVWGDNRWPVSLLSFNKVSKSPWPLAPGAPGLGELIVINILSSAYADQAWADRKSIIGYLKSAAGDVKSALESENATEVVEINDNVQRSITDCIQYLNKPGRQNNLLEAIGYFSGVFDKRVGLNALMYGDSSTQIRVASDIRARSEASQIRPEKYSKDVAAWMSDATQMEMFSAIMYVKGMSLTHLLGGYGASQWDSLVASMPVELAMREMRASVEASEVRRPNHERDTANMQALQQYLLPTAQQFAQETGKTKPLQDFLSLASESMEMPALAKLAEGFDEWRPPVDEESQKIAQAQAQAEIENVQSDSAQKQSAAKKLEADALAIIAELGSEDIESGEGKAGEKAKEIQMDEIQFRQGLQHKQQDHEQKMIGNQELLVQKLLFNEAEATLKESALKNQGAIKNANARKTKAGP